MLLRPQDVGIKLRAGAGDVEQQAARELAALLKAKTGVEPAGAGFEIRIGVLGEDGSIDGIAVPNAGRLKALPNNDQAYVIQPRGSEGLLLAALNANGVYHGVQTLKQLLGPMASKEQVAIPLASVVDWPDMEERGLWNFDLDLIPWLASLKLNFAKARTSMARIRRREPVRAKPESTKRFPNVLVAGRLRALKAVPNVAHLNYIGAKHGAYEAYPQLAGKGDEAVPTIWYKPRRIRVPCAACPRLQEIIAQYMAGLASKGAQEISVWLSEFQGQCQCETCLAAGQLRMETQAACRGWLRARKEHPDLVLRIFYCMGGKSAEDTLAVLMELPPEVKIERCYGSYGKAFDQAAAQGRWLASYAGPPMAKGEFSGMRFYAGSRTIDYLRRVHDRKWRGVYSINYVYSTGAYQRELFDFHVSALGEWAWNLNGRTVGQFAKAWATRAGYAEPVKVAEWVELIDPIERGHEPALRSRAWGDVPEAIKARQPLRFDRGLLAGIPNANAFDDQFAVCEQALGIAKSAGAKELVLETQYLAAFVRSLKALNALVAQAAKAEPRPRMDARLAELRQATKDMADAMDRKTDLLVAEPRDFAQSIKRLHADMWDKRVKAVEAALAGR